MRVHACACCEWDVIPPGCCRSHHSESSRIAQLAEVTETSACGAVGGQERTTGKNVGCVFQQQYLANTVHTSTWRILYKCQSSLQERHDLPAKLSCLQRECTFLVCNWLFIQTISCSVFLYILMHNLQNRHIIPCKYQHDLAWQPCHSDGGRQGI